MRWTQSSPRLAESRRHIRGERGAGTQCSLDSPSYIPQPPSDFYPAFRFELQTTHIHRIKHLQQTAMQSFVFLKHPYRVLEVPQACASIHEEGLTRDEGRFLPGEKGDCRSDLRGLSKSSHRHAF